MALGRRLAYKAPGAGEACATGGARKRARVASAGGPNGHGAKDPARSGAGTCARSGRHCLWYVEWSVAGWILDDRLGVWFDVVKG